VELGPEAISPFEKACLSLDSMAEFKSSENVDYNIGEKPGGKGDLSGLEAASMDDVQIIKPPQKPFNAWSAMCLGYSISNTGIGMVLVVGSTVFGAGPLFVYGTLLIAAVTFCVAITLGELASAYPHAGGQ
jgi:hypothetical protein